jgi:hypothetical protein
MILFAHISFIEALELSKFFPEFKIIIMKNHGCLDTERISQKTPYQKPIILQDKIFLLVGFDGEEAASIELSLTNCHKFLFDKMRFESRALLKVNTEEVPEFLKLLEESKKEEEKRTKEFQDKVSKIPQEDLGDEFVDITGCSEECHKNEREQWNKTLHAQAYTRLTERVQQFNLECLKCHTTGFGYKTGYLPGEPKLSSVQCEACHGPRRNHILASDKSSIKPREISVKTCQKCHTNRTSPEFDPETRCLKIAHFPKAETICKELSFK